MSRAELEARFVKRFGARRFLVTLNGAEGLASAIESELRDATEALLKAVDPNTLSYIELDNEAAEIAVIAAPGGKGLHRALYQQSRFFKWIPNVSISKGRGLVLFELLDATGATKPIEWTELDPFNQYVLLHFVPYLYRCVIDDVTEEDIQSREALQEVVVDKISCLRENSEE